jgi:hypothetical protein
VVEDDAVVKQGVLAISMLVACPHSESAQALV